MDAVVRVALTLQPAIHHDRHIHLLSHLTHQNQPFTPTQLRLTHTITTHHQFLLLVQAIKMDTTLTITGLSQITMKCRQNKALLQLISRVTTSLLVR